LPIVGEHISDDIYLRQAGGAIMYIGGYGFWGRDCAMRGTEDRAEVYDVREVALKTKLTEQSIRAALRDGRLKGFRIGHKWLISREQFDRLLRGET
jgi:excisionase family DNA binding protein